MDRRSWLWRRKSSDKSPGENESSGSVSSRSERFSDEQGYPMQNAQSLEVTSKSAVLDEEIGENVKSLPERLSAAEELVKQHAKVAEEAVSGWEKAESEVSTLGKQLEAATQKNASLETRVGYLDGALKECVRQLRQAKEEREEKVAEAIAEKTEWESAKSEIEKENSILKSELEMTVMDRDLSTGAAESASKQHLESIKRVRKLEAKCLRLKAATRKALASSSSVGMGSFTHSQSDCGERNEWVKSASLVVASAEFDMMDDFLEMEKFAALPDKSVVSENENLLKSELRAVTNRMLELEAEKTDLVAALRRFRFQLDASETRLKDAEEKLKAGNARSITRTAELEKEIDKKEAEKTELSVALRQCRRQLDASVTRLKEAEERLRAANAEIEKKEGEKAAVRRRQEKVGSSVARLEEAEEKLKVANASTEATASRKREMDSEMKGLVDKVKSLEENIERDRVLLDRRAEKCRVLEDKVSTMKEAEVPRAVDLHRAKLKQDQELAVAASKYAECQKTIASLGQKLKSLASLENLMAEKINVEAKRKFDTGGFYVQKRDSDYLRAASESSILAKNITEKNQQGIRRFPSRGKDRRVS